MRLISPTSSARFPFVAVLLGLLLLAALLKVILIILTIDRGFDVGDEGFCLLVASNHYDYGAFFGMITDFLHPGKEVTVIGCRLLKIFLDFLGLLILSWGAFRYAAVFSGINERLLAFFSLTLLFGFLAFYIVPLSRTVSYNDYILLSLHGAFGMTFLGYTFGKKAFRNVCMVLAGISLSFGLQNKLPSSVAALAILLVLSFLQQSASPKPEYRQAMEDCLLMLTGYLALIAFYWLLLGTSDFIHYHISLYRFPKLIGYTPGNLMRLFIAGDWAVVKHLALTIGSTVLVLFAARKVTITERIGRSNVFAIIAAAAFAVIYMQVLDFHPAFASIRYRILTLIVPAVLGFACLWLTADRNGKKLWFALALLSIPFIAIAGSTSALIEGLSQRYGSWFVLCGIVLADGLSKRRFHGAYFLLACVLIVLLSVQFKKVLLDEPFMLRGTIWDQSVPMRFQGIKVDAATHAYLDACTSVIMSNGFQPQDIVLAQNMKSGIPYLLDATMPVCPHYFCGDAFKRYSCYCLSHFLNNERLKFVISSERSRPFNTACSENQEAWGSFSARFALIGYTANPLPTYVCKEDTTYVFKLRN